MSRFTSSALRTAGGSGTALGSNASPSTKSRPRLHGTISCGNHSFAVPRWRSSSRAPVGSSSANNSSSFTARNRTPEMRRRVGPRLAPRPCGVSCPRCRSISSTGHTSCSATTSPCPRTSIDDGIEVAAVRGVDGLAPHDARAGGDARRRRHRPGHRVVPQRSVAGLQDECGRAARVDGAVPDPRGRPRRARRGRLADARARSRRRHGLRRRGRPGRSAGRAGVHLHARQGPGAVRGGPAWSRSSTGAARTR